MNHLYEAMFLLDNDVVRAGWNEAKAGVQAVLEKHGANLRTLRRWDERALAYPIRGKRRGTYLLGYLDLPADGMPDLCRDLEIKEDMLRYLFLRTEEIPEGELDAAQAEQAPDFEVPEPPADDVGTYQPVQVEGEESEESEEGEQAAAEGDAKPAEGEAKAEAGEAPAATEGAGATETQETETQKKEETE